MSDLISRQAAIDVLEERLRANGYSNVGLVSELNRSIGYLMRLPSAEPEPHWIPCSERLPDKDGYYLVSEDDGGIEVEWYDNTGWGYCGVIAWMPLPEPYKEGRDETGV